MYDFKFEIKLIYSLMVIIFFFTTTKTLPTIFTIVILLKLLESIVTIIEGHIYITRHNLCNWQ